MPQHTEQTLNHFGLVRFTPAYWSRSPAARRQVRTRWLAALGEAVDALHLYQAFALEHGSDLIVWSAVRADDPAVAADFFRRLATAYGGARRDLTLVDALWGYTRPSQYTKTRSTQELDPFASRELPYLVMYPFVKTAEWYLKPRDERQAMMLEHIKVGKQYKDITQLLLYSMGLQDQEYVVVYETSDLRRFSQLVTDLRATTARTFTLRDSPLHTGVRVSDAAALGEWL